MGIGYLQEYFQQVFKEIEDHQQSNCFYISHLHRLLLLVFLIFFNKNYYKNEWCTQIELDDEPLKVHQSQSKLIG
jgi:hypothetical protein